MSTETEERKYLTEDEAKAFQDFVDLVDKVTPVVKFIENVPMVDLVVKAMNDLIASRDPRSLAVIAKELVLLRKFIVGRGLAIQYEVYAHDAQESLNNAIAEKLGQTQPQQESLDFEGKDNE